MTISIEDKILGRIDRSGPCWLWTGGLSRGYGLVRTGPGLPMRGVHRIMYEFFIGPIPTGLDIDHICHNEDLSCRGGKTCLHRRCVNPDHLRAITRQENFAAGRRFNGRSTRTHCPRGHPYDESNTYWRDGHRDCRTCRNVRGMRGVA